MCPPTDLHSPTLPSTEGSKLQKDITEFKQQERAIKTNYPPSLKPLNLFF